MLNGYIFIPHLPGFVFGVDERFIQILPDKLLAALYFGPFPKGFLCPFKNRVLVDSHLLHELEYQAVLLSQQPIEEMLLFNLLVAVFQRYPLTLVHCLHGFLRKFIYIHSTASFLMLN